MARYWVPKTKKRAGHYRTPPTLTPAERARRAKVAKGRLLPAAIESVKKKGYEKTLAGFKKYKNKIKSPERLAGWLRTRPEVMKARGAPRSKMAYKRLLRERSA